MTKEQREKITETMGALYMASASTTTDDLKGMFATYADGLAELLADDCCSYGKRKDDEENGTN